MSFEVLAIVQARLSSSRFPRKVLSDLHGAPMVLRQLERLSRCTRLDQVVVATSTEPSDDELVEVLEAHDVVVRRGSLADVFHRFTNVIDEFSPQHVVRLTADCPLTDPNVIDDLVQLHVNTGADYSSNALKRTFPHGLDAECITRRVFSHLEALPLTQEEREHVTLGIYSRPAEFTISSLTQRLDQSALRWTVDYPSDLDFVRKVYEELYDANSAFATRDVTELLDEHPELRHTAESI
jgi:spore coat polysaccharide biosynthesis protein SpsF